MIIKFFKIYVYDRKLVIRNSDLNSINFMEK